ncbi:MAG: protease complex subunit PrcB family protein [Clostridia bacterium]|nr:protease complex subunit PrcB family protein [Clostridia bacterium]
MNKFKVLFIAIVVLTLAGCQMSQQPPKTKAEPEKPSPVAEAKPLLRGSEIKNPEILAWRELYKQQRGVFTQKFGPYRAVLISMGTQKTGGYKVNIEKAEMNNGVWQIEYTETRPQPGEAVTQALTDPHELLAIKENSPIEVFLLMGQDRIQQDVTVTPQGKVALSKSFIVELPREGDTISSPVKVKGLASVFEGAFLVFIEDGHNRLVEKPVQTAGAPAWGKFELEIPFDKPTNPSGTVIFAYGSAKDGEIIEEVAIPVKFD